MRPSFLNDGAFQMTPDLKRAAFLDRDGTIIELVHHLNDPADVRLIDGAGAAIARLRAGGWQPVIITNQSVIGRGISRRAFAIRFRASVFHSIFFPALRRSSKFSKPTLQQVF